MKFRILSSLLFSIFCSVFFSQNEGRYWYFGRRVGLDFLTSPPTVLSNGKLNTHEGCSAISDPSGNLLFYTSGDTIWNKQHQMMANGAGLLGTPSTAQSALIVKQPGNPNIYFVFTLDMQGNPNGLRYNVVDMNLASGNGSVTIKNILLNTPNNEALTGIRHCNGKDVWIVAHGFNNNTFYSYLLDANGLNSPVISQQGIIPGGIGQSIMKISPNGKRLAQTIFNGTPSTIELFDFDISTGVVSNSLIISTSLPNPYGIEFSPDGTKLYSSSVANSPVYQWDLCAGSAANILASQTAIGTNSIGAGSFQLGIDNKIYIVGWNNYKMSVINNPNLPGLASNYVPNSLSITSGTLGAGVTNFIGSYFKQLPASPNFSYNPSQSCLSASFYPTPIPQVTCNAANNPYTHLHWIFGDPASGASNTSTITNPTHVFTSFGTYTVKVIYEGTCVSDTVFKEVQIGPQLNIQPSTGLCNGLGSATVNVSGPLNYTCTWLPGGFTGNPVYSLSPHIYTVQIAYGSPTCVATKTLNLPLNPIQASVNVLPGCNTASANAIVFNGSGLCSYSWTPGTTTGNFISGLTPGTTYTLQVWDVVNQCAIQHTFIPTGLPFPNLGVSGNTIICRGESATLTATGGNSYSWNTGSTNSVIVVSPINNTTYNVLAFSSNFICNASQNVTVMVNACLDIEEQNQQNHLAVYPNPFINELWINCSKPTTVEIVNIAGQLVNITNCSQGLSSIPLSHLPNGFYLLKVTEESGFKSIPILKLNY